MKELINQEFVRIIDLHDGMEAQFLCSILEQSEIPHRIHSYHDTAYDGLFQAHMGWGEIYAPLKHKDEILKIIMDNRNYGQSANAE